MVINPNGTLFIRHSHKTTNQEGRSGQGAIGIYGLLDVPEGLPDEKQVLAMFQQTPQGIRLDLTDKIFKPGDRQGPTEDHPLYNPLSLRGLGDFATSTMWVDAQPQPQVTQGLVHIRKTPLAAPAPGRELVLVVSVIRNNPLLQLPDEHLIDLREGLIHGAPLFVGDRTRGSQPDTVLTQPFYLGTDDQRWAIRSTSGKASAEIIERIRGVATTSHDQRSEVDQRWLAEMRHSMAYGYMVKRYENPADADFQAFQKAMQPHALPYDRLISSDELSAFERHARRAIAGNRDRHEDEHTDRMSAG